MKVSSSLQHLTQSTSCAKVSANKMPARLPDILLSNFDQAMSKASIASSHQDVKLT